MKVNMHYKFQGQNQLDLRVLFCIVKTVNTLPAAIVNVPTQAPTLRSA
jgi:hypothetical protein